MTNLWWKIVRKKQRVIFVHPWWTRATCHRSGLICDEKLTVIKLFWYAWQGQSCRRMLPLEMLSRVDAIAGYIGDGSGHVSPSYSTTWPSLVLAHFRFLLDHVLSMLFHLLGFYWHTCRIAVVAVSLLHWIMCHIFIGPRGLTTISHMSFFTWPCVTMLYVHVSVF